MKTFFLLSFLLIFSSHGSGAVKHSLKYFFTASSGVQNLPDVVAVALVDDFPIGYCSTNSKKLEIKQDWIKHYFDQDPQQLIWYNEQCFEFQPNFFKTTIYGLKQRFNHSAGVHILQRMTGCEWDDETGELTGFHQYGYDGEDFISLDPDTFTWITPKPQAVNTKLRWDADTVRLKYNENFLTQICPVWLKKYVDYGKSTLLRTDLPSVSLLQKSPSSSVSCHATGFYPDRALMFWRKDGEELHEDVEQGEILPNHDGSFQMRVDLDLSSVKPEDWRRYDCVFQLSGVKEDIITKLDKAVIRTNSEELSTGTITIIAAVVVVGLVLIAVAGFMVHRKKKGKFPPSPDSPGLTEKLSQSSD